MEAEFEDTLEGCLGYANALGAKRITELLGLGLLDAEIAWRLLVLRLHADERPRAAQDLLSALRGQAAPLELQVEALYLAAARALRAGSAAREIARGFRALYSELAAGPAAGVRAPAPASLGGGPPRTVREWLAGQEGGPEFLVPRRAAAIRAGGGPVAARRRKAGGPPRA